MNVNTKLRVKNKKTARARPAIMAINLEGNCLQGITSSNLKNAQGYFNSKPPITPKIAAINQMANAAKKQKLAIHKARCIIKTTFLCKFAHKLRACQVEATCW